MLRKGQEGHVRAEREVLKAASLVPLPGGQDWIVKLHYSFQDQDNLYLVRPVYPVSNSWILTDVDERSWNTWAVAIYSTF